MVDLVKKAKGYIGDLTGSTDAMNAQVAAGQQGMAAIKDYYNTGRADLAGFNNSALTPYANSGAMNLNSLNRLNSGDFSGFQFSPDYKFALDSGINAIEGSAAGRGVLQSGKSLKDLMQFGQGLGTQNFNNYTNRLMNMAGMGQNAATTQTGQNLNLAGMRANLASSAGGNIADMHTQIGNAQAAGAKAPFNDALGIAGTAASIMKLSDRRLKTEIKEIGRLDNGLPLYSFTYIWGEPSFGVMADEVKEKYPDAVHTDESGYDVVDYGRILNAA